MRARAPCSNYNPVDVVRIPKGVRQIFKKQSTKQNILSFLARPDNPKMVKV